MSRRLQVLLSEEEMKEVRKLAAREHVTVGERVRRALRTARAERSALDPQARLKAVRRAAEYSFPTGDIEQMLAEIERGYHE